MSTLTDIDPKELRPLLHAEIDRLRDEDVALLHRVALQLELEEVTARLDAGFDADRTAGKLARGLSENLMQRVRANGIRCGMKTAFIHEFAEGFTPLLAWLQQGETVVLLKDDGQPLGKFVPESPAVASPSLMAERERFATRFAPLASVPARDLSDIVADNRGPA